RNYFAHSGHWSTGQCPVGAGDEYTQYDGTRARWSAYYVDLRCVEHCSQFDFDSPARNNRGRLGNHHHHDIVEWLCGMESVSIFSNYRDSTAAKMEKLMKPGRLFLIGAAKCGTTTIDSILRS